MPKDTSIKQIFDSSDIAGRVLILGAPGSGKTTMLLKLVKPLVEKAKENLQSPIPVLLNLSSWKKDKQSIKDWMVTDLKAKYGVRQNIAKQWIEEEKIIPLLDGLDELAAARQEKCVEKINEFLHPKNWSRELVVCSRLEEYQHYSTKLELKASLILQSLTTAQIQDYVLKTKGENLWNTIKTDSDLMDLAKTPLFLNIIIIAIQEISFGRWRQFQSSEERRDYIFNAYIRRMLKRPYQSKQKPYKDKDTLFWLGQLAKELIGENQAEFLTEIWKQYPTFLIKQWIIFLLIFLLGNQQSMKTFKSFEILPKNVKNNPKLILWLLLEPTSLHLFLWFNRYTPWNYAQFLDYSTDRLFLQRVGGGYRFVHNLLRQHFADKY